jgi:hypothetical protein
MQETGKSQEGGLNNLDSITYLSTCMQETGKSQEGGLNNLDSITYLSTCMQETGKSQEGGLNNLDSIVQVISSYVFFLNPSFFNTAFEVGVFLLAFIG